MAVKKATIVNSNPNQERARSTRLTSYPHYKVRRRSQKRPTKRRQLKLGLSRLATELGYGFPIGDPWITDDALAGLAIESVTFAISSPAIESAGIEEAAHSSGAADTTRDGKAAPAVPSLSIFLAMFSTPGSASTVHSVKLKQWIDKREESAQKKDPMGKTNPLSSLDMAYLYDAWEERDACRRSKPSINRMQGQRILLGMGKEEKTFPLFDYE
ncbi:hypothetical protein RJ640_029043 [Escallonia rubra]|uniref:Uncharacterized protein n=1 Tax=Escallonia rubra TaxID=112253 RepID=A0AA88SAA1_9ASTE|nr:hypothetical protein RJ640_029043 [Escallonia rubra]